MDEITNFIRYLVLGIVALIVYSLHLSDLLDAIAGLVFVCCSVVMFMLILFMAFKKRQMYFKKEKYMPQDDDTRPPEVFPRTVLEGAEGERYFHQEKYRNIGIRGQKILSGKRAVVFGLGAQGSVAAEMLCRFGIGKLILIDEQYIEPNSGYASEDVGKPISLVLMDRLSKINSNIEIEAHHAWLRKDNMNLLKSDLVLDCTNMDTRLSDYCKKNRIPFVCARHSNTDGIIKTKGPLGPYEKTDSNLRFATVLFGSSIQVTTALRLILGKPLPKPTCTFQTADSTISF